MEQPVRPARPLICPGCRHDIEPDICGCGEDRVGHSNPMDAGHTFVPLGCRCLANDPPEPCQSRCQFECCQRLRSWARPCNQAEGHDGPHQCDGTQPGDVVYQRALHARVEMDVDVRFRVDDNMLRVDLRLANQAGEQMDGKLNIAVPPGTRLIQSGNGYLLHIPQPPPPPPDPMLQNTHMRAGALVVLGIYRFISWAATACRPPADPPTDDASVRFSLLELN